MDLATPEAGCERGRAVHGSIAHPELTRDGDTPPEDGLDSIPPKPGFLNDEMHDTLGHSLSVVIISNDEIDSEKTDTFRPFLKKTILSDLSSKGLALIYRPTVTGQTSFLTK